jgi:tetratricopeptide (TPR) repeat protein
LSGDLVAAEASNEATLEIGARIDAPGALAAYGSVLFVIRNQQGRLDEIADLLTQAAVDNPALPVLRAAVVAINCALGRLDEARVLFEPEVANGFVDFPRDVVWTTAMTLCADNGVDLGHRQAAQVLYDRLSPFRDLVSFNNGTAEGAISRSMGRLAHLLGRHEDAESLFQAALWLNERMRAPYWTARTKLDYADLLIDGASVGETEKAKEMIGHALAVAQAGGYGALERRAQGLLEALA